MRHPLPAVVLLPLLAACGPALQGELRRCPEVGGRELCDQGPPPGRREVVVTETVPLCPLPASAEARDSVRPLGTDLDGRRRTLALRIVLESRAIEAALDRARRDGDHLLAECLDDRHRTLSDLERNARELVGLPVDSGVETEAEGVLSALSTRLEQVLHEPCLCAG